MPYETSYDIDSSRIIIQACLERGRIVSADLLSLPLPSSSQKVTARPAGNLKQGTTTHKLWLTERGLHILLKNLQLTG